MCNYTYQERIENPQKRLYYLSVDSTYYFSREKKDYLTINY